MPHEVVSLMARIASCDMMMFILKNFLVLRAEPVYWLTNPRWQSEVPVVSSRRVVARFSCPTQQNGERKVLLTISIYVPRGNRHNGARIAALGDDNIGRQMGIRREVDRAFVVRGRKSEYLILCQNHKIRLIV